jgi:hypothetical protein
LRMVTPLRSTSRTLRVTRMRLWCIAVAAIRPSGSANGRPGESVPHTSAISWVTGRILSWKSCWIHRSQRSSFAANAEFVGRFSSIPRRISPMTRTLVKRSEFCTVLYQAWTLGFGKRRLRSSDRIFVSRRNGRRCKRYFFEKRKLTGGFLFQVGTITDPAGSRTGRHRDRAVISANFFQC